MLPPYETERDRHPPLMDGTSLWTGKAGVAPAPWAGTSRDVGRAEAAAAAAALTGSLGSWHQRYGFT